MRQWILLAFVVSTFGCASTGKTAGEAASNSSDGDAVSAPAATESTTSDDSSQVLSSKKKCPRKSKLVNGKCMMQVESDD